MKFKGRFFLISVCLLLISVTAAASDYKSWIPLLPDTLGGMGRSGKPEGINMEMNEQKWSSLHQTYSTENGEKSVEMTLVMGKGAPLLANFQMMSTMKMETDDEIFKTIEVSGYKGVLNLKKNEKSGTLMLSLSDHILVVIEAEPIASESEVIKLAEQLPLAKFAAQVK